MNKRTKLILGILSVCFCILWGAQASVSVNAMEYEGKEVTGVDAEGNVYVIEPENGTVDENGIALYSDSGRIVNFNTKGNAVTEYTEFETGNDGYTNGAYGADAAYLGTVDGKVKFMLSGVIGLVDASEVQVIDRSQAQSVSYYTVSQGRLIHYVSINVNSSSYGSVLDNGTAPSYLTEGAKYYSYDGHYFYGEESFSEMLEDYTNGNRSHAVNADNPYYNYYQYLPFRSQTQYSVGELDQMISSKAADGSKMLGLGTALIGNQNTYGVNALLAAGIAANESAWGSSSIALQKNNLFGLNAVDATPGESANYYEDVEDCVKDFTETYMSKQYLNAENWVYSGGFLGSKASGVNVRYASDPYWGEKAAALIYGIDRNNGSKDYGVYTIGIKGTIADPHTDVNVRAGSSTGTARLYGTGDFSDMAFLVLDTNQENGFYKIQSVSVINSDRTGIDSSSGKYDFSSMYAYISSDYLQIVSQGSGSGPSSSIVAGFTDVPRDSWYAGVVEYVNDRGIMTGMNASYFGAAENVARGQFVSVLHRMAGSPAVAYTTRFSDVEDGAFYTTPVMWASSSGVVSGYANGTFGPADDITREQLAVMLYNYANYKGCDTSARGDLSSFFDGGSVSDFAKDAVSWAVANGLIKGEGSDGSLNPQGVASRAVAAAIIQRFCTTFNL